MIWPLWSKTSMPRINRSLVFSRVSSAFMVPSSMNCMPTCSDACTLFSMPRPTTSTRDFTMPPIVLRYLK